MSEVKSWECDCPKDVLCVEVVAKADLDALREKYDHAADKALEAADKYAELAGQYVRLKDELQSKDQRIKELEIELKQKNENGCCIVEHGYRMEITKQCKDKDAEIARLRGALTQDSLLEVVHAWKNFWMNQNQNSEEDRQNYFNRAFGVDANMKYDLVRRISKNAQP